MRKRRPLAERFAHYIVVGPLSSTAPGPCVLWTGKIDRHGYGWFNVTSTKQVQAHRYAWVQDGNELPSGLLVLHKCDVPNCVNVDHLFTGTHQDNTVDKIRKGRMKVRTSKYGLPTCVERAGKRFRARIGGKPNRQDLGMFDTPEEAADAAARGRKERYGLD